MRVIIALLLLSSLAACKQQEDKRPPHLVYKCEVYKGEVQPRFDIISGKFEMALQTTCVEHVKQCVWGKDFEGKKTCE